MRTTPKPGNWNTSAWNKGVCRTAGEVNRLSPIMRRLVKERIHQRCSQELLAEKSGWSQNAISHYERGTHKVPLAYVEAAAEVLGLQVIIRHRSDEGDGE